MTDLSQPAAHATLIAQASELLLAPSGLGFDSLSQVMRDIHAHDVDFADLYFQHSHFESWKSGAFSIDRGVGVRAVTGDKQAFAYSDDISRVSLDSAARAVRAIGRQGQSASAPDQPRTAGRRAAARAMSPRRSA